MAISIQTMGLQSEIKCFQAKECTNHSSSHQRASPPCHFSCRGLVSIHRPTTFSKKEVQDPLCAKCPQEQMPGSCPLAKWLLLPIFHCIIHILYCKRAWVHSKSISAVKMWSETLCSCRVSKAFHSEWEADETTGYRQSLALLNRCNGVAVVILLGPSQSNPCKCSALKMELSTN